MRKTIYRVLPLALTLAAVGCSEDDLTSGDGTIHAGEEVQFGLSLSSETRTIYGNETSTGFPIYWVDGDLVRVASPQCNVQTAEYMVSASTTNQNYADTLIKTGDVGIQWGTAETADFYSIYPSSDNTSLTVSGESVSTQLYVASTQTALLTDTTDASGNAYYYAEPEDMNNVVMYAQTLDVANGKTVDLQYTPFSTVLEFTLTAPENSTNTSDSVIVQSITLTAPSGIYIAGNFNFTFPGASGTASATVADEANASNSIIMQLVDADGAHAVLKPKTSGKNTLKAKMCLMPVANTSLEGWTITVASSAGEFSKTLASSDITSATTSSGSTATATTLTPGKVHKITMPELNYGMWTPNLEKWMTELYDYKNIYLTELSLPGAWYAGTSATEYQSTQTISDFWNAGIRAFAVECRSGYSSSTGTTLNRIIVSGTGNNSLTGSRYYMGDNAIRLATIISNIASAVNSDEYAVLVVSYADGGDAGHSDEDYAYFLQGLAAEITASEATNIYSDEITPNTLVGDVLGKLILKVNVDKNLKASDSYSGVFLGIGSWSYTYDNNVNALFSYAPFYSQTKEDMGDAFSADSVYTTNMYWKTWSDDTSLKEYKGVEDSEAGQLAMTFSTANRTQVDTGTDEDLPTYENRQKKLKAMMDKSHLIYLDGDHSMWYYFNCGGVTTTSSDADTDAEDTQTFAAKMNPWLLDLINNKSDASPLGLVFYNFCTTNTYNGTDITNAIIQMNNKFYLQHASTTSTTSE